MSTTTTDTGVTSVGGEQLSTQSFTGRPDHGRLRIPVRRVAALLRWPGLPAVHRDLLPAGRAVLRVDPSRAEGESSPLPSGDSSHCSPPWPSTPSTAWPPAPCLSDIPVNHFGGAGTYCRHRERGINDRSEAWSVLRGRQAAQSHGVSSRTLPRAPHPVELNRPGFDGGSDDTEGSLSWDSRKYPDELCERATRMVLEALADPARAKGAIRRIGEELGVHPEALRTWVKKAQVDGGLRPGTTTDEAQRIKELEKEVRELRRANAILKSASACLSRRSVSARLVDLPVHRLPQGGVRGLADLQGAHWRRSQDRPEYLLRPS